ncbi:MAG: heavy metal translocating P-type ATPase [Alcanivorax sp.]
MGRNTISNDIHISKRTEKIDGFENFVERTPDGDAKLSLLISGVHCAGCIQKIESTLAKEDGIKGVRLNFSTKRLELSWDGDDIKANSFVKKIQNLGYGVNPYSPDKQQEQAQEQARFLLLCLGVAGFAMGNIMLLSVGLWSTSGETMGIATRSLMHWISAAIALPAIIFAGRPFFRSALKALRGGHTNMDVPISLALTLASGMSLYETINHGEHVYFDSAVMLMFFLLIGRYLDFRARGAAQSSATDLLSTLTGFAKVVEGEKTKNIPIRGVREGMIIRVAVGEKFPVDGCVSEGQSTVDTSIVTGETIPRDIQINDDVYAGTLNLSNPVTIKTVSATEDSLLADVVRLMEKATQGQAQYVRIADRAAKLYTPVVHSLALLAFLGWWLIGGIAFQEALMIAVTVLIITCPCALGLAVPVVQVLATGSLMKKNVLVKSGDALERLAEIDLALMDKTGTLTLGKPTLIGDYSSADLQKGASLAAQSAHPLSKALAQAYDKELISIKSVHEIAGSGVEGEIDGKLIRLGSRSWCGDETVPQSEHIELWLSHEGHDPVRFLFKDQLKEDSAKTIANLKSHGIKSIILSGDREEVVQQVAQECGIDEFHGGITPPEKYKIMEKMQSDGHKILMVGDGLNDAPTLVGADVSMAPGTAIDMAQNAADIVFMGDKYAPVYDTYNIANLTQKLVKQNFALAVMYNIIAIPLALAGLVTPLIAAIAMSGSSLLVIGNSFRLRMNS